MASENSVNSVSKQKKGGKDTAGPSYVVFILHIYRSSRKVCRTLLILCASGEQDQEVGV